MIQNLWTLQQLSTKLLSTQTPPDPIKPNHHITTSAFLSSPDGFPDPAAVTSHGVPCLPPSIQRLLHLQVNTPRQSLDAAEKQRLIEKSFSTNLRLQLENNN